MTRPIALPYAIFYREVEIAEAATLADALRTLRILRRVVSRPFLLAAYDRRTGREATSPTPA